MLASLLVAVEGLRASLTVGQRHQLLAAWAPSFSYL